MYTWLKNWMSILWFIGKNGGVPCSDNSFGAKLSKPDMKKAVY